MQKRKEETNKMFSLLAVLQIRGKKANIIIIFHQL